MSTSMILILLTNNFLINREDYSMKVLQFSKLISRGSHLLKVRNQNSVSTDHKTRSLVA